MAFMYRFKVDLGNFGDGAPGVNILHTTTGIEDNMSDIGNFMQQIHNGYDSIKGMLIPNMTVAVNGEVTKHSVEDGKLVAVYNVTPPATVAGTGSTAGTSRATQAVCRHNTDAITNRGKRLIGRTYVGPISGNAIDGTGRMTSAAIASFGAMWGGMQDIAGTLRLIVWHRPIIDPDTGVVIAQGSFGHSQSSQCLGKPGVLRGRRD